MEKKQKKIAALDSTIRAATNAQQWYVRISRGRKSIRIFALSKADLRPSIIRSGNRPLALDLNTVSGHGQRAGKRILHCGRELARHLCRTAMRSWTAAFLNPQIQSTDETPSRKQQESARANVLAP